MPEEKKFLVVLDGLRNEYAQLELDLKNEVMARRRRTVPILLRVPEDLLEKIEQNARKDSRNRQNYILKVLSDVA